MSRAKIFWIGVLIGTIAVLVAVDHEPPLSPLNLRADRIVVEKRKHLLTVYHKDLQIAVFRVALGHGGLAPKRQEGDGRTPEGRYVINARKADSAFYKALHISYPSSAEVAAARARGVKPGGDIMIHGLRNGFGWLGALHRQVDWTNGCIAVTDDEMDALWSAVPTGTPVEIRP